MIKKISVQQLKPGMFIHELNCAWLVHPFRSNSVRVENEEVLEQVLSCGMREVYIDTDKGTDIADAPTQDEVNREIHNELKKVIATAPERNYELPIKEEIISAKEIKHLATEAVQKVMHDITAGIAIELEPVESVVGRMVESIFRNQDALLSLGMLKRSDEYILNHSVSVCVLMLAFGKHLGYDVKRLKDVGTGALLHDIGKVMVPREVINKEGRLSPEEMDEVRKHVIHGSGVSDTSAMIVSQHHERMDGSGYPEGLNGTEISEYGQIAAIVDVYDAMTSHRSYRYRVPPPEVLRRLFDWGKFYFNAGFVEKFIACLGIYPIGSLVHLESGLIGVVVDHGAPGMLQPVIRIIFDSGKQSYVRPYDLDLSQQSGAAGDEKILGYASQEHWNINSEVYF
jgi:HD-GYP domain-containing protein (c-di-GMP phosphodiesterase class II)